MLLWMKSFQVLLTYLCSDCPGRLVCEGFLLKLQQHHELFSNLITQRHSKFFTLNNNKLRICNIYHNNFILELREKRCELAFHFRSSGVQRSSSSSSIFHWLTNSFFQTDKWNDQSNGVLPKKTLHISKAITPIHI